MTARWLRYALWTVGGLLLMLGVVLTRFGTRWPSIYYMTGESMEPTIRAGEYFLAWSPPEFDRGDIVIFHYVEDGDEFHVLRRLAGLPGDTVGMQRGVVVVNGRHTPWRFHIAPMPRPTSPLALTGHLLTWGPWIVPQDSVLLLADRRDMMGYPDSRFIGFVARDLVLAEATRTLGGRRLR